MDSGVVVFLSPEGAAVRSQGRQPLELCGRAKALRQPWRGGSSVLSIRRVAATAAPRLPAVGVPRCPWGSRPWLWTAAPSGLKTKPTPESIMSLKEMDRRMLAWNAPSRLARKRLG